MKNSHRWKINDYRIHLGIKFPSGLLALVQKRRNGHSCRYSFILTFIKLTSNKTTRCGQWAQIYFVTLVLHIKKLFFKLKKWWKWYNITQQLTINTAEVFFSPAQKSRYTLNAKFFLFFFRQKWAETLNGMQITFC